MSPRSWLTLALGAVASALTARLSPVPGADPFAGTLVVLPLLVAALLVIGREGEQRGARGVAGIAPLPGRVELPALVVLVGLVFARRHLGLEGVEAPLAAGFLLLLAQRTARQVLALRPLLGRRLPARPSWIFALLPFVVYLALVPWSTHHRPPDGDEPYYLLITHSLAYDLDADLANNYARGDWSGWLDRPLAPQPGDPVGPRGELYSRHNELLPLVLAPAYRLGGKMGALVTMALLTALLAWMVLRLAHRYYPRHPGPALVAWALCAFTPPLLLYSYQVWVEVPAALLSMVALDRILALKGLHAAERWPEEQPQRGWRSWLAIGLPVVLLPLVKIRFMLLAVPLVALAWWHAGRPRKPLIALTVALVLVGGGILVFNQVVYDNPLKIHHVEELELTGYPPSAYVLGSLGLFWDAAFGLFGCAPVWLLLLPALLLALPREDGRRLLFDLAVFVTPYLVVVVPRAEWYGGWSPPFRYALVALPLLALLPVPLLARRRGAGARGLAAALLLATAALTLLWVLVPGWTYDFADGRTYLLDHLSRQLGADVARFFPSMVRPRAATWIWPPVSFLLVSALWWWPRRRPRGGARGAALWGAAALFALAAVVPWAADELPTRRVEFEDRWLVRTGGHLFPDRWVIERTRYRGGWVLGEGSRAIVPVEPGGELLTVRLDLRFVPNDPDRPLDLELRAGQGETLATWRLPLHEEWTSVELGPFPWPAGQPLVVVAGEGRRGRRPNGVLLDRAELDWR